MVQSCKAVVPQVPLHVLRKEILKTQVIIYMYKRLLGLELIDVRYWIVKVFRFITPYIGLINNNLS